MSYHDGITSQRLDIETGEAMQVIGLAEPSQARELIELDARLVAAFDRVCTNGQQWQVYMFAASVGTVCVTVTREIGAYDAEQDFYDDEFTQVIVERSNAYGDSWNGCDSYRLFPLPTGNIICGV